MVDTVSYMICLSAVCFFCMFLGWIIGKEDAKKQYKKNEKLGMRN